MCVYHSCVWRCDSLVRWISDGSGPVITLGDTAGIWLLVCVRLSAEEGVSEGRKMNMLTRAEGVEVNIHGSAGSRHTFVNAQCGGQ